MPYQRTNLTLVAPAAAVQRAEQREDGQATEPAEAPAAGAQIDLAELAERVYRLMLRDALTDRERMS